MRKELLLIIILFCCLKQFAFHIVGGEIIYDKLSGNDYRITVKVYRDCFSSGAPFDGTGSGATAILTTYEANGTLFAVSDIGAPVITPIAPSINNPCIQPPGGICVEQGIYTYTLNLPPKTGGYYIVYQRCCRNSSIINLTAPDTQGSTYYAHIPGPETVAVNNSPRYNNFPPIFICNNVSFTFDHSATDPDGDQLVYSLCTPFQGLDNNCPSLSGTGGCPSFAPPPPYQTVNYSAGFSGSYPIASNPAFSINPITGLLTGKPNMLGQFVVGVCVQEFRGGVLIDTHYRDFQFNVVSCIVSVSSVFADQLQKCQGSVISFTNQSSSNIGALTYLWDFGVPTITSDTTSLASPTYTYQDTGKYVVTLIANPNKPCSDTIKKTVYVYPPLDINYKAPDRQCLKGNSFNFSLTGQYVASSTTFTWNFTSAATPSISSSTTPTNIVFNQPGKYFIKLVANMFSCKDSVTDTIRVIGRPEAKINNLPQALCDPAKIGFSNGSTSDLPVTYTWLFSNGNTSHEFQPVQVFTPPGVYSATLIVQTSTLCIDTSVATVSNITVNPVPKAGFIFTPTLTTIFDPDISFFNTGSDDIITWNYNFGDGSGSSFANEVHTYQDYGDYLVKQIVINQYGCTDTIDKTVTILPEFRFWIPNTFTPDNNSLNDVFMPIAIGVVNYEFDIFNRWGEHIFSTKNVKTGWDGSYKSKRCEQDVYVWKITFKNVVTYKDEVHFGHVLLLRQE